MAYKYCSEGHVMDLSGRCVSLSHHCRMAGTFGGKPGKIYPIRRKSIGSGAECEIRILDRVSNSTLI